MLIEIHMIQNHSPSNLNRDDLGAPKTCVFGGVTRARISSQCLKRSIRNPGNPADVHNRGAGLFFEAMQDHIGLRTSFFPDLVKNALESSDIPGDERKKVVTACTKIAKKEEAGAGTSEEVEDSDTRPRLPQLVFLESSEAQAFVSKLSEMRASKEWQRSYAAWIDGKLKDTPLADFTRELSLAYKHRSVDIALFGRMTTSAAFEDVEAAIQVAHAISTHAVINEVDYFTAIDDLGKSGGGAGHVDEAMFNSACFYKYFCLDWNQFVHNLTGPEPGEKQGTAAHKTWEDEAKLNAQRLAACALGHLLRAAALTTPSGKQNSFAAHNLPEGILVEVKNGGKTPISYTNAFAEPVEPRSQRGLIGESIARLGQYVHEIADGYGIKAERFWFSPSGRYRLTRVNSKEKTTDAEQSVVGKEGNLRSFDELVEKVVESATGLKWSEVKDLARKPPEEA